MKEFIQLLKEMGAENVIYDEDSDFESIGFDFKGKTASIRAYPYDYGQCAEFEAKVEDL